MCIENVFIGYQKRGQRRRNLRKLRSHLFPFVKGRPTGKLFHLVLWQDLTRSPAQPLLESNNRFQERLKQLFWFECQCIPCKENWPLMHEMTDETLNFRCVECGGTVPMSTSSTNPLLKCSCGTPVRVIQVSYVFN